MWRPAMSFWQWVGQNRDIPSKVRVEGGAHGRTDAGWRAGGENPIRHPNESEEYRRARQELLIEEIELRRSVERVASRRRDLPPGGELPDDYHFVAEDGSDVSLSGLFGAHDTLIIYSYMFGPQRDGPCPMCTSLMGGLDHKIADIRQRVASPSPPARRSNGSSRPRHLAGGTICRCTATPAVSTRGTTCREMTQTCRRTTCSPAATA